MTTKPELFAECRRMAPDFVLAWTTERGMPVARASATIDGRRHEVSYVQHYVRPVDAECAVMHGLLDAAALFANTETAMQRGAS